MSIHRAAGSRSRPTTMRSRLVAQFGKPEGSLGRVAGWIMAHRPSNRSRNSWTVDLLELRAHHRVLEIGFGPGLAVQRAARRLTGGEVVGVDHSETMVAQATARNRVGIAGGRVRLLCGSVESLPADIGRFDRIYSANVVQFWSLPERVFARAFSLLAPGGRMATTYQPRHRGARAADAERMAERIVSWMETAGFQDVRVERLALRPVPAVSVLGRRPNPPSPSG